MFCIFLLMSRFCFSKVCPTSCCTKRHLGVATRALGVAVLGRTTAPLSAMTPRLRTLFLLLPIPTKTTSPTSPTPAPTTPATTPTTSTSNPTPPTPPTATTLIYSYSYSYSYCYYYYSYYCYCYCCCSWYCHCH